MTEEAIIADEQNEIDESNDTTTDETSEDEEYVDVNALQAELEKAKADKEKWEARYKSTKKQEASKPQQKQETKEVDLDSLVERKLAAIEEQRDFIKTYGEETFKEIKKIKDQHPTLSLNDAYRISPIANDPASKQDPQSLAMGGRANQSAIHDSKSISVENLTKLDKVQYSIMKDRIKKGEITLKQ